MKRLSVRWFWIAPTCLVAAMLSAQAQRLGTIDFPTSGPPAAQASFIRGVLLLHSFEYQDAARAFREAQGIDPGFALAYWGEALTYTHPLWDEQDVNAARASLLRLGPTRETRRAQAPTPRERAYLDAVEILYGDGPKARRDTAYSRAMERLVARFPADREAQVFYAASLLGLSQGVRNIPTYLKAAAIVAPVFRDNPDHPGAAHLLIHCYDDPVHAPLGLAAARAYAKIAPDAAHAHHMTTHIFVALGMWDEVVSQNELASGRDPATWAPDHYTQWLGYGYLEQGRYREALRHLERMRENVDRGRRGRAVLAQMRAEYVVNTEQWDSPSLQWNIDLTGVRARDAAVDAFVAGLAALKGGDRAAAGRFLADLAAPFGVKAGGPELPGTGGGAELPGPWPGPVGAWHRRSAVRPDAGRGAEPPQGCADPALARQCPKPGGASPGSAARVCAPAGAHPEARPLAAGPGPGGRSRGGRYDGGPSVCRVAGDLASRRS